MKRRDLLKSIPATAGLSMMFQGVPLRSMASNKFLQLLGGAEDCADRVLVLIQLNGGNDGLNTIVPMDSYSSLNSARPNVIIPENNLLNVSGLSDYKLHPSLSAFKTFYEDGNLSLINSVGYPDQNFSHFRSTDIWLTASGAEKVVDTGWMGRTLDEQYPDYPASYPNTDMPHPLAIQIGYVVSPGFHGPNGTTAYSLNDPDEFYDLVTNSDTTDTSTPYGHELAYIRQTALQTSAYATEVKNAADSQANLSTLYPPEKENELADQLKIVARLIGGGLKTRMYMVNLNGFDTHAGQVANGDPLSGAHATLLQKLSVAMNAFQDDIRKMGQSERVLSMTFSEFGRRIVSNNSNGTDHGAAAPMMLVSDGIDGSVFGNTPTIPNNPSVYDNIPMEIDFRSVYGSILKDWFCLDEDTVRDILLGDFQTLPLVTGLKEQNTSVFDDLQLYPNPADNALNLKLSGAAKTVRLEVYSTVGVRVANYGKQSFSSGVNTHTLDISALKAGAYFLRVSDNKHTMVKPFVVY